MTTQDSTMIRLQTDIRFPYANFVSTLTDRTIFSKIDPFRGYYQIILNDADILRVSAKTIFEFLEFFPWTFIWKTGYEVSSDFWKLYIYIRTAYMYSWTIYLYLVKQEFISQNT